LRPRWIPEYRLGVDTAFSQTAGAPGSA
jgi:hypothetical protein